MDLSVKLCNVNLKNPTILASGFMGVTGASMAFAARSGAGAVTMKSLSLEPRKGHPCPVILSFDKGLINAVGLSCSGMQESLDEIGFAKKHSGVPVIASIFAGTKKEFGMTAKEVSKARPDLIEVNISCPNVHSEFGRPFGSDPKIAAAVTREVKKSTDIPVIVKLTPNVADIKEIACAVSKAGADAINAINTLGPGMIINTSARKPVLSNKRGGLSGPAIKPIAVRCVYDIYEATKGRIPIIGTGGVTYGNDAVEMFMAGASAVGIGSAIYYRNIDAFRKICFEITGFMKSSGYSSIKDMVGAAHED